MGGSNNSRWAIIALIPMWLRNNLPRIRYRVFMKTPTSAVFYGQTDSPYNSLFWWGNTSIRANGGNSVMNGLSIWTGGWRTGHQTGLLCSCKHFLMLRLFLDHALEV